ncbi:MAG: formate dehydrogenase accessory protein FdhE [Dehalococcoidales bacterium]|jgi:FdhE protein|nr:formate dehydrogenase accessory protein FdhE [Dehalococcoidales bacterium]
MEEWAGEPAHSSRFISFYLELLQIHANVEQKTGIPAVGIPQELVNHRIFNGQPLIRFEELDIDWSVANDVFKNIAQLFKQYSDVLQGYSNLETENIPEINAEIAQKWLDRGNLDSEAEKVCISPTEMATLIHHTMRPFLTGYALAFKQRINQQSWRKGNCPVCGSAPSFSYLEKENGALYLICSCCNMDWLFQRLHCPFCNNTDQPTLSYHTDEKGLYRLYLCDKCKGYLKAVDLKKTEGELNLGLEAIITADLDLQARELGYLPGEILS